MEKQLLNRAYEEYAARPMPKINENHRHDRSKFQLEEEAIRGEITWIARKYGLTFIKLDTYIEERSKELFSKGK